MVIEIFTIAATTVGLACKGINKSANNILATNYVKSKGYNQERQLELWSMMDSYYPEERRRFSELLGHEPNRKNHYTKEMEVRKIAEKEGWTYFDIHELYNDKQYRKLIGIK